MDPLEYLPIRFHFGGEFIFHGGRLVYGGGSKAISFIERERISLPDIEAHLRVHWPPRDGTLLHWLFPNKDMVHGLRALTDDKGCKFMCDTITEGQVADIYVEYSHLLGAKCDKTEGQKLMAATAKGKAVQENSPIEEDHPCDENSSSDSDYLPGDDCPSEEDEEADSIRKKFMEFKKKVKKGETVELDDILYGVQARVDGDDEEGDYDTPYEDSSDDDESFDEEDGHLVKKNYPYPRYDSKVKEPYFSLGMMFTGKKQFKKAIIKYSLYSRRVIKFVKDEADRCRAKCTWPKCTWAILVSPNSRTNSWQVSSLNNRHTCPPRRDNKLVTARRIVDKFQKMIRANPSWSMQSLRETVQEEMFADVSISKCKRAKSIVIQKMLDGLKGEYSRVFDYQEELLRSNPGSTIIVKLDPDFEHPVFHRFYVCLQACKEGFQAGCRKVIGLDGCFFKGATCGELLCALGRDANNQMFPVAWAIVEKETNESWDWFCSLLFKDICIGDGAGWVVISDQQKGILNAVEKWAPCVEHRMCARHIYANWRKNFKDKEWQKDFWRCAKSSCRMLFNYNKAKLSQKTRDGATALMNTDPCHWSQYIEENTKSLRWDGIICPNILKKVNTYITESGFCHVTWNGRDGYEVRHYDKGFTVSLENKTCSCRYWQLSGLPCCHALSCIYYSSKSVDEYIAPCYSVMAFKRTYAHCLQPLKGMSSWPVSERPKPKAPKYVKMPGRPRKERRREPHEKPKAPKRVPIRLTKKGTIIRCTKCKGTGHNRASCDRRHAQQPSARASSGMTLPPLSTPQQDDMVLAQPSQQSSTNVTKKRMLQDM